MTRFLLAVLLVLPALAGCVLPEPEAEGWARTSIPRGLGPAFENATVEVDRSGDPCPDCSDVGDQVDVTAQRIGSEIQVLIHAARLEHGTMVIAVQPISEGAMSWHGHVNTTAPEANVTLNLPLITGSAIVSTGTWEDGFGAMSFQSRERIDIDETGTTTVEDLPRSEPSMGTIRMEGSRFLLTPSLSDSLDLALAGDFLNAWLLIPRADVRDTFPTIDVIRGQASIEETPRSSLRSPEFQVKTLDIPLTLLVMFEPQDRPSECAQVTIDAEGFETIVKAKSTPCR